MRAAHNARLCKKPASSRLSVFAFRLSCSSAAFRLAARPSRPQTHSKRRPCVCVCVRCRIVGPQVRRSRASLKRRLVARPAGWPRATRVEMPSDKCEEAPLWRQEAGQRRARQAQLARQAWRAQLARRAFQLAGRTRAGRLCGALASLRAARRKDSSPRGAPQTSARGGKHCTVACASQVLPPPIRPQRSADCLRASLQSSVFSLWSPLAAFRLPFPLSTFPPLFTLSLRQSSSSPAAHTRPRAGRPH